MNGTPLTPVNLTARLNSQAVGNPAAATLASGVANCFPGLEFDHRNLDRRFFPGLVVEYTDPERVRRSLGGLVRAVDLEDPLLADDDGDNGPLIEQLRSLQGEIGSDRGRWWLGTITQAGVTIDPSQLPGVALDGTGTWRVVRSLEPGPLTIVLYRFRPDDDDPEEVTLKGRRRPYLDATGGIDPGYRTGELTQSLCSPWQHDFRDCGCYYWASNHPDIAIDQAVAPEAASRYAGSGWVDWLRVRSEEPPSRRYAYYEISHGYQDLAIVLHNRETDQAYKEALLDKATPYPTAEELVRVLHDELAPLEHVLILEYLYAWSSVRTPGEVDALDEEAVSEVLPLRFRTEVEDPLGGVTDPNQSRDYLRRRLRRDVTYLREELRSTAISEMQHLGWVNELLRRLASLGVGAPYAPALGVATDVPRATPENPKAARARALRPLLGTVVDDFIAVEGPSGGLEGRYAQVRKTLMEGPLADRELSDIAARIVQDGVDHFRLFSRVRAIVDVYDQTPPAHLRPGFAMGREDNALVARALRAQQQVLTLLANGYTGDAHEADVARRTMLQLEKHIDDCAAEGLGVPFFA